MAQSLVVYNLGQEGLDLVNSPLHIADGSLLHCQNGQLSPNDEELSIRKRDGMSRLNSTDAAGKILAIFNIPQPNP